MGSETKPIKKYPHGGTHRPRTRVTGPTSGMNMDGINQCSITCADLTPAECNSISSCTIGNSFQQFNESPTTCTGNISAADCAFIQGTNPIGAMSRGDNRRPRPVTSNIMRKGGRTKPRKLRRKRR